VVRSGGYVLAALLVPLGGAAEWSSTPAGIVRVRVLETSEPVQVGRRQVAPAAVGLEVDGAPSGNRWSPAGAGPHRAGDLTVRGRVEVQRTAAGLRVVNDVPLEDYVAGTLGREIYPGWEPATLAAQAVVTRTYALHQRARRAARPWDVSAGTSDQVYGGVDAEGDAVRAAVRATSGEVLEFEGAPVLAVFHSSSGGRTASAEEVWGRALPYLVSLPVTDEQDSPDTYWRVRVPGTKLGRALVPLGLQLGAVREVRVVERSASGRALTVRFEGDDGGGSLRARDLRDALGASVLRSTLFEVRQMGGEFIFVGSGHGHGVGMSQWGAQAMARRGASYREILEAFYPGTELVRRSLR
jgi:stage II sporulation protein D